MLSPSRPPSAVNSARLPSSPSSLRKQGSILSFQSSPWTQWSGWMDPCLRRDDGGVRGSDHHTLISLRHPKLSLLPSPLASRERSTAAGRRVRGYGFPGWFPKPSPGSSSRPLPQGEVKEGCPPPSCRTACVHPLRRHPGLDPGSIQPGWPSFETPEAADAWIPAFAGMTREGVESFSSTLGSQLRPPYHPLRHPCESRDPFFHSSLHLRRNGAAGWIPACAGMTAEFRGSDHHTLISLRH